MKTTSTAIAVAATPPLLESRAARLMIATWAGLSLLMAGMLMTAPAHAEGPSVGVGAVEGKAGSLTTAFSVWACQVPGGTWQIFDDANKPLTQPAPITSREFSWTAPKPGEYVIKVSCLNYNDSTTGTASTVFRPGYVFVATNREPWRSGDQVTLTADNFPAGTNVTLTLWNTSQNKAVYSWTATAGSDGKAATTVTWPAAASDGTALVVGSYSVVARAGDRQGSSSLIQRDASGVWGPGLVALPNEGGDKNNKNNTGGNNTGGKNTKGLPKTGD